MKFLRALFRRKAVEAEMAEELQSHIQARTEHLMRSACHPNKPSARPAWNSAVLKNTKKNAASC
ncbi:MAG: permease prefix domain 1-containing protein [Bryobacteraceae bacterium]